ncbi:MAG TPA: 5'/3'-nucleotidase SurE, partial [Chloroflexi bacterium]|nr:5'/3'-nucleotidase SurE [Chloroflexota bacterium]
MLATRLAVRHFRSKASSQKGKRGKLRKAMPYILVTNDDGVEAPGLLSLKKALEAIGEVAVFAPDHNWSAAGHPKTMHKPLRVEEVRLADGTLAYASNGAPSDCVALAILGLLPRKPDLVVSGINLGGNMGHDITYSGTVAAAIEAVISGIPAIAVSIDTFSSDADYSVAARFAARLARYVLEKGLPPYTLLNVNVPALPADEIKGVRLTRLGRRVYKDVLIRRKDPRGKDYYWL